MKERFKVFKTRLMKIPFFREMLSGSTLSILIAFIVISIGISFMSPYYLTLQNFKNIGLYASIIGIMAAGATVAMLMAGLDLTQHAVAAFSSVLTAIFAIRMGLPLGLSLIIVLAICVVVGLFNGVLIAVFGISPMIATMGSQYIIRGLCYILTGAETIVFQHATLAFIGRGTLIFGIPNSILIMVVVFLVLSYVLNKTPYGRKVYAVGSNERAAYLSGINPVKTKLIAYVISAVCSGSARSISMSQLGASVPSSGLGSEMEIIASVYLGGVAAAGGKGSLFGTFLGILVICVINNGLTLAGVQSYWQTLVRGIVILVAVYMNTLQSRKSI